MSPRKAPTLRPFLAAVLVVVTGALGVLGTPPSVAKVGDHLPWELAIHVSWGRFRGPDVWRTNLENWLVLRFQRDDCFASNVVYDEEAEDPADLVMHVIIEDYEEQQVYDVSQAALNDPNAPPELANAHSVRVQASFDLLLLTVPEAARVRSRELTAEANYTPRFVGEDAARGARLKLVESVGRAAIALACKGNEKKLEKAVAEARASAASN